MKAGFESPESYPDKTPEMGPQAPCDAERFGPNEEATLIYPPVAEEGFSLIAEVGPVDFAAPNTKICPLLESLQKQQEGLLANGKVCVNCRRCRHNVTLTASAIPQLPSGK